jgi:hypothetical protein
LGGEVKIELFTEIVKKLPGRPIKEDIPNKILKAYAKMKHRAEVRKAKLKRSTRNWKPQIGDPVLVKSQPVSDTIQGVIAKFHRPYIGPFWIKQIVNPSLYQVQDKDGVMKGLYNLAHLKPYISKITVLSVGQNSSHSDQ